MSRIDSDAIVLRHVRQGDTSHVVTLFAREGGKVAVMAKGSRKPGSRFGAGLDLFNHTRIGYRARAGRDLVFLDTCELEQDFASLATDVLGYAAAGVCSELVDRLVPDGAPSQEIFELLLSAFSTLAATAPLPAGQELRSVAVAICFQLKLMDELGIAPELTGCVHCGDAELLGSAAMSAERGGLICGNCRASERAHRLSLAAVDLLRGAAFDGLERSMTAAEPPTRGTLLEARSALDAVLEYHHQAQPKRLKSRKFLDSLWLS